MNSDEFMKETIHEEENDENREEQLATLPVRVSFDLGSHSFSLGELTSLSPGYVFDLGLPLKNPVRLRVNGVCIGYGEIVEIDGRIGVMVSSITGPQL